MAIIIQIYNQKGGVGKTTSTVQLAGEFAKNYGKRVLLFDFDPSSNLSDGVGHSEKPEMYFSDILLSYYEDDNEEDIHDAICASNFENIDLVPAVRSKMERAATTLSNNKFFRPEGSLAPFLKQIEGEYDIILFDSSAGSTVYNLMAMCVADYLLIPTDDSADSAVGANLTLNDMKQCKKMFNPDLDFIGMYLSRTNGRRGMSKDLKEVLGSQYQDKFIPVFIRDGAGIGKARIECAPLCYVLPRDNATSDFHGLASYIMEYIERG